MSAFKPLLASDVQIVPFTVNKTWTFATTAELTALDAGIDICRGINDNSYTGSTHINPDYTTLDYQTYRSVRQLYYTDFLISSSGDPAVATQDYNGILLNTREGQPTQDLHQPDFENFLQSTVSVDRYFPTQSGAEIVVISIPQKLFGQYIVPSTFTVEYLSGGSQVIIADDGEGNLKLTSADYGYNNVQVGNIIYTHGIATITNNITLDQSVVVELMDTGLDKKITFQSAYTIYETQVKCTIEPQEFTTTLNPTLQSGSLGEVYSFATSSYFQPYVTTVGFYNDNQELLMVAKLAQPLQMSPTTDTNIIVNIDR